jgi:hypothetical protein
MRWLLIFFGLAGLSFLLACDQSKATTRDLRDRQIREVSKVTAYNEQNTNKPQHRYQLREVGLRKVRFDSNTGRSCIQTTTKEDWKLADTIRQGCEYQDWAYGNGATYEDYLSAECQLVNSTSACEQLIQATDR